MPWKLLLVNAIALAALSAGEGGTPMALSPGYNSRPYTPGFAVYDVAAFWSYYSDAAPASFNGGGIGALSSSTRGLGGDSLAGASASMGWSKPGLRSSFSIIYSPSYFRRVQYSGWHAMHHSLGLNWSHGLTPRLTVSSTLMANISDLDTLSITGAVFARPGVPGQSFSDLTASILTSQLPNDQIASLLTGTPMLQSPAETLFFGNRYMLATLNNTLAYHYSKRLSFSGNAGISRIQHLSGTTPNVNNGEPLAGFLTQSTFARAGAGMSYELNPRTSLTVNANTSRALSAYFRAYVSSVTAGFSRMLTRRLFAQAHYGAGFVNSLRSDYALSGPRQVFGSVIGARFDNQSFTVGGDRTVADPYGIGGSASYTLHANWSWQPPARHWSMFATASRQHYSSIPPIQNGIAQPPADVGSWIATVTASRRLGEHLSMQFQYSYASYSALYALTPYDLSQHVGRIALVWNPMPGMRAVKTP